MVAVKVAHHLPAQRPQRRVIGFAVNELVAQSSIVRLLVQMLGKQQWVGLPGGIQQIWPQSEAADGGFLNHPQQGLLGQTGLGIAIAAAHIAVRA